MGRSGPLLNGRSKDLSQYLGAVNFDDEDTGTNFDDGVPGISFSRVEGVSDWVIFPVESAADMSCAEGVENVELVTLASFIASTGELGVDEEDYLYAVDSWVGNEYVHYYDERESPGLFLDGFDFLPDPHMSTQIARSPDLLYTGHLNLHLIFLVYDFDLDIRNPTPRILERPSV
ncbi:hypothetical protein AVEN_56978-1 [Araneus ventricosus]|uniref:Uncharacterized protein n=1 Tax=Araneus ventricosus TaxID=182803 RepID=A0A4Y2R1G5_ARAVE|nr:hypothetical protein AVEN_56978-1 [Araneus ventricosus]